MKCFFFLSFSLSYTLAPGSSHRTWLQISEKKKDYKWTLFRNSHVEKLLVLQPVVLIAGSWRSADSLGPISVFQWGKEWDRKWTEKKWLVKTKDSRAEKMPFIYAIFLWFCHVDLYIVFHYHKYNADLVKWQRLKVLVSISFSNPLFVNRVAFWRGSWTIFMRFRLALQRPRVHLLRVCDHSSTSLRKVTKPTLTPLSFIWSSSEFTVTFTFSGCIEDVTKDGWINFSVIWGNKDRWLVLKGSC